MEPVGDVDPDRLGEAGRLIEARFDVAPPPPLRHVGKGDDGLRAAGEFVVGRVGEAQAAGSSSSCSMKLIGRSGCTVEMACL
jgi:hypothetical protein